MYIFLKTIYIYIDIIIVIFISKIERVACLKEK